VSGALDVIWHDVECGAYVEDLPLWRELAAACGGPVLDVGAGTGRVTLDLARGGVPVVALDVNPALCAALRERAAGLPVDVVCADARVFDLGRRVPLVIVPMQTIQLLGGPSQRAAFLRRALAHLEPRGLLAVALADALEGSEEDPDDLPRPDELQLDGVHYVSQAVGIADEGGTAAIHRVRQVIGPEGLRDESDDVVRLDRVDGDELRDEAVALGFSPEPSRSIDGTEDYVGSTVVVVRAP
jgi:SAM-dependent methyltransferase